MQDYRECRARDARIEFVGLRAQSGRVRLRRRALRRYPRGFQHALVVARVKQLTCVRRNDRGEIAIRDRLRAHAPQRSDRANRRVEPIRGNAQHQAQRRRAHRCGRCQVAGACDDRTVFALNDGADMPGGLRDVADGQRK